MQVIRNNLLLVLLFAGGIVLPTAILSVLSFRNIQNELYLSQKNFDDNISSFQDELKDAINSEQEKLYQEIKAASIFLYEQPQRFLDFGHATQFKSVTGIDAIFLFNNKSLVYPNLSSKSFFYSKDFASDIPTQKLSKQFREELEAFKDSDSKKNYLAKQERNFKLSNLFFETRSEQTQSLLRLIRFFYKEQNYNQALKLLNILEDNPHQQGYLHADLTRAVNLLHFEILVKERKHQEAQDYCLKILSQFLDTPSIEDISQTKFFFETAFTQILSFENLTQEKREAFWNLRENFNRQLGYIEILFNNKEFVTELLSEDVLTNTGVVYKNNNGIIFLKMSYPYLSGSQIVIAKIDNNAYSDRILNKVKAVVQSYKNIPFSITDSSAHCILSNILTDANIIKQYTLLETPKLEISLYERNEQDIRNETRQRMLLMYGLMLFALITVIIGSFFTFKFITQEHKLLSMKANFLSSVSHELKTPLTSIKMFAEMMAKGRIQRIEKIAEYSNLIGKEATRLESMIGAILNYTRMEHGKSAFKWEKLDFSICAKKVFDAIEDIGVEKGLTFYTHFEPNVFILGDYTALYSLAQNLIDNAIKYTNAPGNITIRVYNQDDFAVFSVTDTGIGIAPAEQKNIFNDFYRVGDEMTRSSKGSGIGLATVKRVVKTHKATISLVSKLGEGSTFTVKFKKAE